jgi:hypothetical protein
LNNVVPPRSRARATRGRRPQVEGLEGRLLVYATLGGQWIVGLQAEEVGFEPTVPETGTPVFETGPFNHSGTPPRETTPTDWVDVPGKTVTKARHTRPP